MSTKKKLIIFGCIIAVLVLLLMPLFLYASFVKDEDKFVYELQQNDTYIIKDLKNSYRDGWFGKDKLVVPATHKGKPVVKVERLHSTCVKELVISDGIEIISDSAFAENTKMEIINLPDSLKELGSAVFSGTNLKSLTIPQYVEKVDTGLCRNCVNLVQVTLPDAIKVIAQQAFNGCSSLTDINIPDNVTEIGNSAFSGCSSMTSVIIPDGVTVIGNYVFSDCNSINSIKLPDGVTEIGTSAFDGCSSLTSIEIPDSVTSIGTSAFSSCNSLPNIIIPDSVTEIGTSAFNGCSSLTNITIPNGVTSIGNSTFSGCNGLTSITIPDGVTTISASAFTGCSGLKSLYYRGTADNWESISSGNTILANATVYYYSLYEPELNEDKTAYNGNYWHYVNDEVVIWTKEN